MNDRSCWIDYFVRSFLSTLHHIPPIQSLALPKSSSISRCYTIKKNENICKDAVYR